MRTLALTLCLSLFSLSALAEQQLSPPPAVVVEEDSPLPFSPWATFGTQVGAGAAATLVTGPMYVALGLAALPLLPGEEDFFRGRGPGAVVPWVLLGVTGLLAGPAAFAAGWGVSALGDFLTERTSISWWPVVMSGLAAVGATGFVVVATGNKKTELINRWQRGDLPDVFWEGTVPLVAVAIGAALVVPTVSAATFAVAPGGLE
jgi:hypothetical protein